MRELPTRVAQATLCFAVTILGACGGADPVAPSLTLGVTEVSLNSEVAVLEGVADSATITLDNPGPPLPGIRGAVWIVQGAARRRAADTAMACGGAPGEVPAGPCTVTLPFLVSGSAAGTGVLAIGGATAEVQLADSTGRILGMKTTPLTLVPDSVSIFAVHLDADTLTIGGALVGGTTQIYNPGATRTGGGIQAWVDQGTVRHPANGAATQCGAGAGVLPSGGCALALDLSATNGSPGFPGTLVAGAAALELDLSFTGTVTYVTSVPIILK